MENNLSNSELQLLKKMAYKRAIKFAKSNTSSELNNNDLMNRGIYNSGMTCEDVAQELWLVAVMAYGKAGNDPTKEDLDNTKMRMAYTAIAIDNKVLSIASSMLSFKRGGRERHITGDDTSLIFEGQAIYEEV